ncbi:YceI family protein [Spirillospora sp. NPDC047279]|uniref:YceI family protein n=1 Tax=Spirillospora sp. NPDC047279 TaxID=3155478 RepID=UPI0034020C4A
MTSTNSTLATTGTSTTGLPLKAGEWGLDPLHSEVGFTIRHLGISKVRGAFRDFDASLSVGATLADIAITATVKLASIDTGNPDRDDHVRSPELMDVASRPEMTFRSTGISGAGDDWTMAGDLTIGDVTRAVTLAVEFGGVVDSVVDGRRHAGFEATGEIRRGDFGLKFAPGLLGEVVKIALDMQFVEPE